MTRNHAYNSLIPFRIKKATGLFILMFLGHLIAPNSSLLAQSQNQKIRIDYINGFLTISANDAYLKNVLFKLAEKSNFFIEVPVSLNKKVTINRKEISLREALRKLLRGLNHAIVYSISSKKQTTISEVYVYEKSRYVSAAQRRIANRIKSYERQIESLKNRLSKIDENSKRGKGYLRRIERIENRITSLERQLN